MTERTKKKIKIIKHGLKEGLTYKQIASLLGVSTQHVGILVLQHNLKLKTDISEKTRQFVKKLL